MLSRYFTNENYNKKIVTEKVKENKKKINAMAKSNYVITIICVKMKFDMEKKLTKFIHIVN